MRARVLIAAAALTLSLALPGAVGARSGISSAQSQRDATLAYWTPARIASATWKDYRLDAKSGKITPFAGKPGSASGTGASWTGNGAVVQRVGRILFSSGGSNWICSGTVVAETTTGNGSVANGYSVVLTAGHCVYDTADGWSSNFVFYPNFDAEPTYTCQGRVNGCWTATRLAANSDFVPSGFGPDAALRVDYGFAKMATGTLGELDVRVGGYELQTSGSVGVTQWAFGYPAEGRYKGKDLIYCTGATSNDPYSVGTWGIACNMNGGSSGGGWLYGTSNPGSDADKQLASVNSYGYSGLTYMFGPKFNSETNTVMADVIDGTPTAGQSVVH